MSMSGRRFRTTIVAVALLAIAIGVAVWMTAAKHAIKRPARDTTPAVAPTSVEAIRSASQARADTPPQAASLPAADTALVALWSSLQARAQAGDSAAACRLAIETLRCAFVEHTAPALAQPAAMPSNELAALFVIESYPQLLLRPPELSDQDATALDTFAAGQAQALERCDGMQPSWSAMAPELLRAAAFAGQPDAQALYASGEGWFLATPGALASPTYEQWAIEAPLLLARMLDAGHPEAPGLLAGAYSGQTWLAGLYQPDIELAAAYLMLNARLMGKPELAVNPLRELDPAVRARARDRADAMYEAHYAGRDTPTATYWLGAGTRLVSSAIAPKAGGLAPCTPPASP